MKIIHLSSLFIFAKYFFTIPVSMIIKNELITKTINGFQELYRQTISADILQIELTNPEFAGDYTLVVFPLLKFSRKSPQDTASELGLYLKKNLDFIKSFEVVKGFLNITVSNEFWLNFFRENFIKNDFNKPPSTDAKPYLVEYSSPNTNKPLHLGHIRNNLIGFSIAEILKANGKNVIKINLINDRGIHICKSMLAWMKWGNEETPESSGLKGDHLIGKYYILFDKKYREEVSGLVARGLSEDEAAVQSTLMKEAQEMLQQWEKADPRVIKVWTMMNDWVYKGFELTYQRLGITFDQTDHESNIYLLGKELVREGLLTGAFFRKSDGSVWVDLTSDGLDEKLLLRSDDTSVYITQDIGTAQKRYEAFFPEKMIYVVGNEQMYHFEVLKKVLKKLGRQWSEAIFHLSYGMVELPHGRMKSREGTVVDADDLLEEMFETAKITTEALGKSDAFSDEEKKKLFEVIGLAALKYYILKVDPKKNMLFNPEESIDFNGNTGPFILYTYARIQSIFRKAGLNPELLADAVKIEGIVMTKPEKEIIKFIYQYPEVLTAATENFNPSAIANYCFDLVKLYNHYYQDTPIFKGVELQVSNFRMALSWYVGKIIRHATGLLGIGVTDRM